ncbi:hypothetical protein MRB53_027826 [Persea americana]|uniref:Uncharacterized protein n=1 Tax=Persea americana TaxID=3435 RepID=A0ACC2KE58_PERAE|nr:hypothetical protein MRB53_027826 [Persea americana]
MCSNESRKRWAMEGSSMRWSLALLPGELVVAVWYYVFCLCMSMDGGSEEHKARAVVTTLLLLWRSDCLLCRLQREGDDGETIVR